MTTTAGTAHPLPFEQRACFIAGPAKSGTTLLTSLLDGHPELLVLPEETAYFPTVLTKYGRRSRREQFDYLTKQALASVMFGAPPRKELGDYSRFPTRELLERFDAAAFDPVNANCDLLVILMETYASLLGRSTAAVRWWVEKTPANRDYLPGVFTRFPHARVLMTIRDPRALLATQIQLEQSRRRRRFSIYLAIRHWRTAARVALQQQGTTPSPHRWWSASGGCSKARRNGCAKSACSSASPSTPRCCNRPRGAAVDGQFGGGAIVRCHQHRTDTPLEENADPGGDRLGGMALPRPHGGARVRAGALATPLAALVQAGARRDAEGISQVAPVFVATLEADVRLQRSRIHTPAAQSFSINRMLALEGLPTS